MPMTLFGIDPIAQFTTSMLWTCCSTMWSPDSQLKYSQFRHCHSISVMLGSRFLSHRSPMFQ